MILLLPPNLKALLPSLGAFLCALGLTSSISQIAVSQESAKAALEQDFGLHATKSNIWVLDQERRLPQEIGRLGELRQQILVQKKALGEKILQNNALWKRRMVAETQLEQLQSQSTSSSELANAQRAVELYQRTATHPAKLGDENATRGAVVSLIVSIQELQLHTAQLRREVTELETKYADLANQPKVEELLGAMSPSAKLGPGMSLNSVRRRLADFAEQADAEMIPIYLESGQVRVGAIVNDRYPATFTWSEDTSHAVITDAMYRAWTGQTANGTLRSWRPNSGSRTRCRQESLDYIRIGSAVLRDVEVLVLPPEQESVGAVIGPKLLNSYQAVCIPAELQLRLTPLPE